MQEIDRTESITLRSRRVARASDPGAGVMEDKTTATLPKTTALSEFLSILSMRISTVRELWLFFLVCKSKTVKRSDLPSLRLVT